MSNRFSTRTSNLLDLSEKSSVSPTCSKRTFIILGILVGLFAISTVVLAVVLALQQNSKNDTNGELCVTPYCVKAANYLVESLDETVDPCEDFYNFVCGKWIKNARIPDDAGAISTFELLRTQLDYNIVDLLTPPLRNDTKESKAVTNARILYHSCLNEANIEVENTTSILSIVNNEFGGWPILEGSSWNDSSFNLFNILLQMRKYNNDIIFGIGTSVDDRNSSQRDIIIGLSDLGLGQRIRYMNESDITVAYRQFIRDLATALAKDTSMIENDVKEIFAFEKRIAQYYLRNNENQSQAIESTRTTVGNLSQVLQNVFDFTSYLRSAYLWAGVTLNDTELVKIDNLDYLQRVSTIINQTQPRILQNYAIWRFMMHRVVNMPKRFQSINDNFQHVFRGIATERPRKVICGSYVNNVMGFAVSKIYIKNYFDDNARNQSFEMISNIRKAFIDILKQTTWMDETSRNKAIEKAEAIDEKIGYPDYLASDDTTQLDTIYAEYVFNSSYISNVLKLLQLKAKEDLKVLRTSVDRKAWGSTAPSIVNAFYTPAKNQITFPAAILQMPFFDKDAPKYLNYGGIGVVIGHEITHGFDNNGRQFDKDGDRIPWWSDATIEEFNRHKTCIINQYSNYSVPQINMTSNGQKTQGEDIADNGGLRESFSAYGKWARSNPKSDKALPGFTKYSNEQMFFINYAHTWCTKMTDAYARTRILSDVHSLGQFRVIGPTSNFNEFDRAFNCKPGQGNSRVQKCIVWG